MSTLLIALVALASASAGTGLAVLGLQGFLFALQYRADHDGRWHGRQ
jgi:hypothetical protein